MTKKPSLTLAVLSAFAFTLAAPSYAQNTQNQSGQSSQDQMTPGASPSDNTGTQSPRPKHKKKKSSKSGQSNQGATGQMDSTHPGNSNQTGVPTTQPGGAGTQSGANPNGAPASSSSGNSSGTTR